MKVSRVLMFLCLMSAYAFVDAMDFKRDAYLKFKVGKELNVLEGKAKNMEFAVSPTEFTGKNIIEIVPLSPEDQTALKNGFQKASVNKKKEKVQYTLKDKQFVAAIKYKAKKDGFSVKVKEAAAVEKK